MKSLLNEKGFSLVEVLVALSIVSFLSYIGFISYSTQLRKARDGRRQSDLEMVRGALEIYRADNREYPFAAGVGGNYSEMIGTLNTNNYINTLPNDPQAPTRYYYYNSSTGTDYDLCAFLEGSSTTACGVVVSCSASENCNYGTESP
jgi:general secretion pathway protein G